MLELWNMIDNSEDNEAGEIPIFSCRCSLLEDSA